MRYRTFLGFDCAYVSFAWTYIDINIDIIIDLSEIYTQIKYLNDKYECKLSEGLCNHTDEYMIIIDRLYMLLANFVIIREISVVDLINGKKIANVSEIERARVLKNFLNEKQWVDSLVDNTIVCIEHQPPKIGKFATNSVSPAVSFQLAFYFCDKYQTIFIDPKLKGNLKVREGLSLLEVAKRKPRYTDRKKHIKLNLIEFAKIFNIDISNIAKDRLADAGDSLFQIFAAIGYGKFNLTL